MKKEFPNASESFKRLNPELYNQSVARSVRASQPERDKRRKIQDQGVETSPECRRYRVVFTVYRKRLLDDGDNDAYALKPCRDHLVQFLGMPNDSKQYFDFEYHQIKSSTVQGTHILIQRL